MLLPFQIKPMAPVNWQVGRLGEAPDVHPGVILDLTTIAQTRANGSVSLVPAAIVAVRVTARAENGGGQYTTLARQGQPVPTAYLWPRKLVGPNDESLIIPGLDDFENPIALQEFLQQENATFVASAEPVAQTADPLAV